ncbi:MAG TPA: type VI secretion system baseplate subunit TssG [Pirellulales bacterium]|jgi:type VI secretion system protein ImpH|nr:type VI secretion system baseplate subunit TssG [Pirellulales bacterium]
MAATDRGTTAPLAPLPLGRPPEAGSAPSAQAAGIGQTAAEPAPGSLAARLFAEPYAFDFFQAVRLLEQLDRQRRPIGDVGPAEAEVVRFRTRVSLDFPASAIYELTADEDRTRPPSMTINFFGLTGPSGVLPSHYTDTLFRLERDYKHQEAGALRDWLDLFNHRLVSLFYRAWRKYRPVLPLESGDNAGSDDRFARCLFSLVGLGLPALSDRLRVSLPASGLEPPEVLDAVDPRTLLFYSGLLAHRPRSAVGLAALLQDYFQVPVEVKQFFGRWLKFTPEHQSRLGVRRGNCQLGADLVLGERVWDVQGRICVCLGPLDYAHFVRFLPDPAASHQRKSMFLLTHLSRLYAGPEFDLAVQVVLKADQVPDCRLVAGDPIGARLGWNTWLHSRPRARDADDAIFEAADVFELPGPEASNSRPARV